MVCRTLGTCWDLIKARQRTNVFADNTRHSHAHQLKLHKHTKKQKKNTWSATLPSVTKIQIRTCVEQLPQCVVVKNVPRASQFIWLIQHFYIFTVGTNTLSVHATMKHLNNFTEGDLTRLLGWSYYHWSTSSSKQHQMITEDDTPFGQPTLSSSWTVLLLWSRNRATPPWPFHAANNSGVLPSCTWREGDNGIWWDWHIY